MSRALGTVAKLVVSLGLIAFLVSRYAGDEGFRETIARLDPFALGLAFVLLSSGLLLSAVRWKILLAAAGVSLPLVRAVRLYFVGYFFNFFLPTTVGGDVVRAVGVGEDAPLPVVAGSILVERFLGFACLLAIGLVASFAYPGLAAARQALLLATGAFVAGWVILTWAPLPNIKRGGLAGRVLRGLRKIAVEFRAYGFHAGAITAGVVISLVWQLVLVLVNVVLAQGLGGIAPTGTLGAIVPVVQAVSMIPVSFGGLGVREFGYEFFFRVSGLPASDGVALGVCFLAISVGLALLGGLVYLAAPVRARR